MELGLKIHVPQKEISIRWVSILKTETVLALAYEQPFLHNLLVGFK